MNFISETLGNIFKASMDICKKKTRVLQPINDFGNKGKDLRETMSQTKQAQDLNGLRRDKRTNRIEWHSPNFSPVRQLGHHTDENENIDPNIQVGRTPKKEEKESHFDLEGYNRMRLNENLKCIKEFLDNSSRVYQSKENLVRCTKSLMESKNGKIDFKGILKDVISDKGMDMVKFRAFMRQEIKLLTFDLEYTHVTLHQALKLFDQILTTRCLKSFKNIPILHIVCVQISAKLHEIKRFPYQFIYENYEVDKDNFTVKDILQFENFILQSIKFNFDNDLCCNYIDLFTILFDLEVPEFILAQFLCEMAVDNYKISCQIGHFEISVACILLTREEPISLESSSSRSGDFHILDSKDLSCSSDDNPHPIIDTLIKDFNFSEERLTKLKEFVQEKTVEEFDKLSNFSFKKFKGYLVFIQQTGLMNRNWAMKKFFHILPQLSDYLKN